MFRIIILFFIFIGFVFCEGKQDLLSNEALIHQYDWYYDNKKGDSLPFVLSLNNHNGSYSDFHYDLIDFGYTASNAYVECNLKAKCLIVHEYNNKKYIDASIELINSNEMKVIYISAQGAGNLYSKYSNGKIPPAKLTNCKNCLLKRIKKGSIKINE